MGLNQFTKVDKLPFSLGMTIAACLTFLLLLVALFQVVSGQVEQARVRQAQYDAAQVAISGCITSYSGPVRRQCVEQVNAGFMPYSAYTPRIENSAESDEPFMPGADGFQKAAFVSH